MPGEDQGTGVESAFIEAIREGTAASRTAAAESRAMTVELRRLCELFGQMLAAGPGAGGSQMTAPPSQPLAQVLREGASLMRAFNGAGTPRRKKKGGG